MLPFALGLVAALLAPYSPPAVAVELDGTALYDGQLKFVGEGDLLRISDDGHPLAAESYIKRVDCELFLVLALEGEADALYAILRPGAGGWELVGASGVFQGAVVK